MERTDIEKQLLELPEAIHSTAHDLQAAILSLEDERDVAKQTELVVLLDVNAVVDDKGKKLYTNEAAREAEVQKRLAQDPGHSERKAKIDALTRKVAYLRLDLQKAENLFAAYRAIAGMQAGGV